MVQLQLQHNDDQLYQSCQLHDVVEYVELVNNESIAYTKLIYITISPFSSIFTISPISLV